MNKPVLYLGSSSQSRTLLLEAARIPFVVIKQTATEHRHPGLTLDEIVVAIAREKMATVQLPLEAQSHDYVLVLTADTLMSDTDGNIFGKPQTLEDARNMLHKKTAHGAFVATGFCCTRQHWTGSAWVIDREIAKSVKAFLAYAFTDESIEYYLKSCPECFESSGALRVEGFGAQFIRSIQGSYTTVLGLPLAEVREALEELSR